MIFYKKIVIFFCEKLPEDSRIPRILCEQRRGQSRLIRPLRYNGLFSVRTLKEIPKIFLKTFPKMFSKKTVEKSNHPFRPIIAGSRLAKNEIVRTKYFAKRAGAHFVKSSKDFVKKKVSEKNKTQCLNSLYPAPNRPEWPGAHIAHYLPRCSTHLYALNNLFLKEFCV